MKLGVDIVNYRVYPISKEVTMDRYQRYKPAIDKANAKYKKANVKRIVLQLNRKTDQDIIRYLEGFDNVSGELKRLIRESIK